MNYFEGKLDATGKSFVLVASRFNEFITSKLIEGAQDCLIRHNADDSKIDVVWVPGAFELPQTAKMLVNTNKYSAVICLGTIIRGSTPHFDYVASEAAKGIAHVASDSAIPVIFGVLTTDSIEQAIERAGTKSGNKGFDAAMTAIEMSNLFETL
jgi:6,7-dimethyl-8-ribityllumazine synthase